VTVGGVVGSPAGELVWHQGRQCEAGACIELASLNEAIMVRSSANPDAVLTMSRDEWQKFLADLKDGLFDQL
jgi:hypothetical protein